MKKAYSIAELLVSLMIWVVIIVLFAPTLIKKVEKPTQIKVKQEKIKYDYDFSNWFIKHTKFSMIMVAYCDLFLDYLYELW